MLFINVEAVNARNAELRRTADRDRRHCAPQSVQAAPEPPPSHRPARRIRAAAAVAVARSRPVR